MRFLTAKTLHRIVVFTVASAFTLQSVSLYGAPAVPYRTQVEHFISSLKPESVWDQPTGQEPAEIVKRWEAALQANQDKMFANSLSDIQRADHFELWIESLRNNAFFGDSANPSAKYYANHPLDVFGLLGQTVQTKRVETRLAKIGRRLQPVVKAKQVLVKGLKNAVEWTFYGELSASASEPHDGKGPEPKVRHEPYFAAIDWKKLVVEVLDEKKDVVRRLNPKGADISYIYPENGARAGEISYHVSDKQGVGKHTMRLSYQGQVLNEWQNNLTAVATFGQYLVFIEPGKTNVEQGIVNLTFVDLDFFERAVGRTVLPMFRLPVKVGVDAARDVEKLKFEVTHQGLRVGEQNINSEVFEFFSWMQQMAFNTTVSLTDPQFYDSTAKVVNSLIEEFDTALDTTAQELSGQMERAGVSMDMYKKFRGDLNQQLKLRAETGVATGKPRELERAHGRLAVEAVKKFDAQVGMTNGSEQNLEMLTKDRVERAQAMNEAISKDVKGHLVKAEKFGQQLVADRSFQEAMQGYSKGIATTRKLTNRISAFFARMVKPQPLGAPKIQQALGMVAAGVTSKDTWKDGALQACRMSKEGLTELVANRKSRMALEVLTGAALCTLYPGEAAQAAYHAIDVGRTLTTGFLGWMDNWAVITKETWKASWAWLDMGLLYETYVSKDRFHKLAIGVGAMYGTLLATAGLSHVVVNGYLYGKALKGGEWKRHRKEGLGFFASFKQSLVSYVNQDRKKYYAALARADKKRRGQNINISLPGGADFKGLFRSSQVNDFKALSDAERNGVPFNVTIALVDGRQLTALAVPGPKTSDSIFFEMDLPDDSKLGRVLKPIDGDWQLAGNDETMADGTVAEIKLDKTSILGILQNTEWTEEENKMLEDLMEDLARKDEVAARRMNYLVSAPLYAMGIPVEGKVFNADNGDIQTLNKAIRHLMFGYSSWTHTTRLFGKIWNPWFLLRNFWVKPRAWFTMMTYPNVFNRMVWNNGVSTYFDGGKRIMVDAHPLKKLALMEDYDQMVTSLDRIEKFEKDIIPAEQAIHQAAMRHAFMHLIQIAAKDPELIELLSQGGKVHPFDKKFSKLNKKLRVYFESYFAQTFEESLRTHIMGKMGFDPARPMSDQVIKTAASAYEGSFNLTDSEADALVKQVIVENAIANKANEVANGKGLSPYWERMKLKHWRKVGVGMDANSNGSLKRYKLAETQMDNEEAMARATRQYMVGLVVDKPVELLFTFLFLAGIESGVSKPLYDDKFGPDSAFYLSRYVFWNGYFVGIMISLLADVWMKIQMDARVDNLGGFDNVPTAEEYKKGFVQYYKKNLGAEDNKWWDNQKMEMQLSFINMPAYFVTAMVSNLAALGRFDLDSFISVYKGALLPTGGLGYKLENAFEMSANYVVGGIPTKFHSDPRVQEFRNRKIGKLRLGYNAVYKTVYENPLGNLIGNWMTIPVEGIGPRAWMRQFYGGYLPTEVIVNNGLRPLQSSGIPFLTNMADGCDALLTTNHTDASKLAPKLAN